MTPTTSTTAASLLLSVKDVSRLVALSVRELWRLVSAGQFPQPVRIGRSTRWRRRDIEEWTEGLE